jgi:hypothetical protein
MPAARKPRYSDDGCFNMGYSPEAERTFATGHLTMAAMLPGTGRRINAPLHISRTNGFVWIERAGGRPWLITPEAPEAFVRALSRPRGLRSANLTDVAATAPAARSGRIS